GQVLGGDDQPAANVEVMLLCPQNANPDGFAVEFMPTTVRTDGQGRFQLEGFTGEVYWLEARGTKPGSKEGERLNVHSPARKVVLNENLKNIKLVLSESGFTKGCNQK